MDAAQVLNIALPVVFICVGIALIVVLVEAIKMIRTANAAVKDIHEKVNPVLDDVKVMTAQAQPLLENVNSVMGKVDPLMDRVNLTVDAANLEIMRIDGILENVTDITAGLSSATSAADAIANAPVNLVSAAAEKARSVFKPRAASDEAKALGEKKDTKAKEGEEGSDKSSGKEKSSYFTFSSDEDSKE